MKKNTLSKLQLIAFLSDAVNVVKSDILNNNVQLTFAVQSYLDDAERVATVKNVTHDEISFSFEKITIVRNAVSYFINERVQANYLFLTPSDCMQVVEDTQEQKAMSDSQGADVGQELETVIENLPYIAINSDLIFNRAYMSEEDDKKQIRYQLQDAPLLASLRVNDLYIKRTEKNYLMTDNVPAIEAYAVTFSDYIERFNNMIQRELNNWDVSKNDLQLVNHEKARLFFKDVTAVKQGLIFNTISAEHMEKHGIKSPKFSKHLIKTFGEKSLIASLFNIRPSADDLTKLDMQKVDGLKVVVSNLACNVMKMTANNNFSSCQNYTYSDFDSLEHLSCLPSSVHDESLSIAYLCRISEDIKEPKMISRLLLKPIEYNGKMFIFGYNGYGDYAHIVSTLKVIYGKRFIHESETGIRGATHEHTHKYNYTVNVDVEYEGESTCDCYMCEGSGNVTVTVKYDGYEFETTCPNCDGNGYVDNDNYDNETFCNNPYVNGSNVDYDYGSCTVTMMEDDLIEALEHEAEQLIERKGIQAA
jgi:hypothetical protein